MYSFLKYNPKYHLSINYHEILESEVMHLFKLFIQDLDTSLSALPDNIELILLGDVNVNFTGSNLNIDK